MGEVPLYMCPLVYRGTSRITHCFLLGPYRRPMPKALWWFQGVGVFS